MEQCSNIECIVNNISALSAAGPGEQVLSECPLEEECMLSDIWQMSWQGDRDDLMT